MPRELWHNVSMSQAAIAPLSPPPFQFDWKEIERGLPLEKLQEFSAYSGVPMKNLLEVVIPPRTLKHRRQKKEPLSIDESDRLARVAKIYELAVKVYGSREGGKEWLIRPKPRFDEKTPLAMLRTQAGEEAVQESLIQLAEGMYI
jgi:putative toxin-antitoxin system antitoxin component (TIGR02293 family)